MEKLYLILLCVLLFSGCGGERGDRERGEELCRLLLSGCVAAECCDSVVLLADGLSNNTRLDVLLASVSRCVIKDVYSHQEKISKWLEEAKRITPEKRRVEVKMEEIRFRIKTSDPDTVLRKNFIQEYDELEKKYKLSPSQRARFLCYKIRFYQDSDLLTAWMWMKEALKLARKANNPLLELELLEYFATIAMAGGDYEWAISLNEEAYGLRKQEDLPVDEWKYWSYKEDCLFRLQRYPEAISCWDELLRQSTNPVDENNIRLVLFGKLRIFMATDSLACALDVLREQEKMEENLFIKASVWGKIAGIFEIWEMSDSAGMYFSRAAEYYEKLYRDDTKGVAPNVIPVYRGYASLLWQRQEKQRALDLLEKATSRIPRYSPSVDVAGDIYLQPYLDALLLLGKYYREAGKKDSALEILFRRDSLRDKLLESDVWYKKQQLTERYRNRELQARIQLQQLQLSARKRMLITVSLICVTLAGMLGMLWVLYRQKRRSLDNVYRKQKEVERLKQHRTNLVVADTPETLLFNKLEKLVMEQQLFCRSDLSLDDLCTLVGSNRTYVSACINSGSGMNFSTWINKIRVDYVLVLIREGCNDLTELFIAAGFASQTSFYRNFKLVTQMTPRQYLDRERRGIASRDE